MPQITPQLQVPTDMAHRKNNSTIGSHKRHHLDHETSKRLTTPTQPVSLQKMNGLNQNKKIYDVGFRAKFAIKIKDIASNYFILLHDDDEEENGTLACGSASKETNRDEAQQVFNEDLVAAKYKEVVPETQPDDIVM